MKLIFRAFLRLLFGEPSDPAPAERNVSFQPPRAESADPSIYSDLWPVGPTTLELEMRYKWRLLESWEECRLGDEYFTVGGWQPVLVRDGWHYAPPPVRRRIPVGLRLDDMIQLQSLLLEETGELIAGPLVPAVAALLRSRREGAR